MHGPRSLIQDKFKLFIVTLIDESGKIVSKNIDEQKDKLIVKINEIYIKQLEKIII